MLLSPSMSQALLQTKQLLHSVKRQWLVGGSCGLLLQGVAVSSQPRDLDIYTDEAGTPILYAALKTFATDVLERNELGMYRSHLCHFNISGVPIELVGGFQVRVGGSDYRVEVDELLVHYHSVITLDQVSFQLMPLAHELVFNVLRERPDRYEAIADKMKTQFVRELPLMLAIIQRNHFTPFIIDLFSRLLSYSFIGRMSPNVTRDTLFPG